MSLSAKEPRPKAKSASRMISTIKTRASISVVAACGLLRMVCRYCCHMAIIQNTLEMQAKIMPAVTSMGNRRLWLAFPFAPEAILFHPEISIAPPLSAARASVAICSRLYCHGGRGGCVTRSRMNKGKGRRRSRFQAFLLACHPTHTAKAVKMRDIHKWKGFSVFPEGCKKAFLLKIPPAGQQQRKPARRMHASGLVSDMQLICVPFHLAN